MFTVLIHAFTLMHSECLLYQTDFASVKKKSILLKREWILISFKNVDALITSVEIIYLS